MGGQTSVSRCRVIGYWDRYVLHKELEQFILFPHEQGIKKHSVLIDYRVQISVLIESMEVSANPRLDTPPHANGMWLP